MIKFYRTNDCPVCRDIDDTLTDLCLVYETVIVKDEKDVPDTVPSGTKLPFLIDEGEIVQGSKNIIEHLDKLEEFKKQWYKFQSDACYCDDEGNID